MMRQDSRPRLDARGLFYGVVTVQVFAPWHMTKVPDWLLQLLFLALVKFQSPVTTPLLSVPATVGVPFDVPVRFPVIVSVLPVGVMDTIL